LPAAHNNLCNAYRALERWDEAYAAYASALSLASLERERPELQARVHANQGFTLQLQHRRLAAIDSFRRAAELAPEDATTWRTLGDAYAAVEDYAAALSCFQRVVALRPEQALAHSELGWALQEVGRLREAAGCYRRALELQPDLLDALLSRGDLHEELGEMAQAEDCYRRARAAYPRAPGPLARLAILLRGRLPDAERQALQQRLEDPALPPGPRSSLLFGLAHVHDTLGEYTAAADCLARANPLALELRRQQGKLYDPAVQSGLVDRIIAGFTPELFARLAGAGDDSRQLVFVFGMPRSGTTLVEQVLASHSRVHGAGELGLARGVFESVPDVLGLPDEMAPCLKALDAAAVQRLGRSCLENLQAVLQSSWEGQGPELASRERQRLEKAAPVADAPGGPPPVADAPGSPARIVDKMPDNYLHLGLLALLFPNATFIHVRRDLRDVAVSCWMTNFGSIRWANEFEHLAGRICDYRRLMAHWQAVLPVPVHEVVYERLVDDFETEARRLVAASGLEWEPACARFHETKRPVRTASVTQVRQPLYRRSLERWKHYQDPLAELFALLPEP
jgi:tetratricopeptide (TPR) repeat protein